jgi:hypothetical protein
VIASGDMGSRAASLVALSCTVRVFSSTTVTGPAVIPTHGANVVEPLAKFVFTPVMVYVTGLPPW